jgi:uncharacterized protein YprB with RNaseH-like and TPR domain
MAKTAGRLYRAPKKRPIVKPEKQVSDQTRPAKILLWDIECTHLKADFGTILCIGWKWLHDKKVHVPAITDYKCWKKDPTDDSELIRDFNKILLEADMIVTYNGKRFDWPYIIAKNMEHDIPIPPNIPHIDLYFTAKANLCISRKSLANVAKHLKLRHEKTPVTGDAWKKATAGHKPSIKYVVDHCIADVLLLEEAYIKMRPLCRTHPRVRGYGPCSHCGSTDLVSRGYRITTSKMRQRRLQCNDCGSWSTRPA